MNRFVLNETSYHGKGAINAIPDAVKANDGEISVRAREGGGTVFTVVFPLSKRKKEHRP